MSKKEIIKEIRSWIFTVLLAFIMAAILNSKVLAKVQVQQSSMENTLFSDQQLLVDKLSYNFEAPKSGDIIIFLENEEKGTIIDDTLRTIGDIISKINKNPRSIEESSRLVKRVIGIAGDEVDIKDGYVYLNGKQLDEPYVKGQTDRGQIEYPVTVGKNQLFVLGDNREVSKDSREFGLIECKQVEGKAIFRVFPFNKIGKVK